MKRIVYIIMALVAVTAGCSRRPSDARLLRAEALIDSVPAEVLAALDSLDPATLSSRADRALYALLLTKARDKNYIFDKDDSLITTAVDYFTSSGDDRRLMQALFYQGQVKYNADSLVAAMPCLLAALDLAAARDDYFMQGKCHELIALLYFFHFNQDKATSHSRLAAEYFEKAGGELYALYNKMSVAVGLSNSNKSLESLALLDSIAPQIRDKDKTARAVFYAFHIRPLCNIGRGEEALEYLRKVRELYPYPEEGIYDYGAVARAYIAGNILDSAEIYIKKYESTSASNKVYSDVTLKTLSYQLAAKRGKYEDAFDLSLEAINSTNQKTKNDYLNSLAFAERDYYVDKEHKAGENAKERGHYIVLLITIISIIVLIVIVFFIVWRRRKIHKMNELMGEARRYFDRCEELNDVLGTRERELYGVRKELDDLYRSRFESLNHLSKIYFESPSASDKGKLLKDIGELMKEVNTPLFRENVLRTVNALYGNIIETLENSVDKITEREVLFYAFMVASLSPEAICLILGLSKTNYYTLRSRVQNKILDSGSENVSRLLDPLK